MERHIWSRFPNTGLTPPPSNLSINEKTSLFKLAIETYKLNVMTFNLDQVAYDTFIRILNKYITAKSMKELEAPLNAQDPRAVWTLLQEKISKSNGPMLSGTIRQYADRFEWGIQETLFDFLYRHELLWDHLLDRSFVVITGYQGPYRAIVDYCNLC